MYAAKVKVQGQQSTEVAREPVDSDGVPDTQIADDSISFSAGNPRVEHITGVVHLFRQVPVGTEAAILPPALPDGHHDRLCVLSMPADLGVAEFCTFLGAYLPSVKEMRLVRREGAKHQCLVFLRFDSVKQAALFYKDFNGKPFSSLEPDVICNLVFIKDLEILSGDEAEPIHPPPGQTELPTCPVCLDRLDQHISGGVVTTVCNHKFHNECLRQWGDESCPVCRYCASADATTSHCSTCGTQQDLWICLICGHVGCGRYRAKHSIDHWKDSGHVYALELETQRVWDYVGDGYVHRLIQSKTDGKLVEVPSPAPAAASSRAATEDSCSSEQARGPAGHDSDMQDALFASKVDAFAAEYNHLLVSQLDSQRQYYEGLLRKQDLDAQRATAEAQSAAEARTQEAQAAVAGAKAAVHAQKNAEHKLADTAAKLADARTERDFLSTLNENVMRNQAALKEKLATVEKASRADKAKLVELEDQVRDLMIFIEARQTVANSDGELQQGTLVAPDPPAQPSRRRGASKQK